MTAREILVDGIPLHVREAGRGPALLLVHGFTASNAVWSHTVEAFADRWRVIAPDLPGHGRSGKPDAPYTIDFYAGVLRSLGHELGIEEAIVVGNSLGGQIAIELALTYPAWTRAVALVAPAGGLAPLVRPFASIVRVGARPEVLRFLLPRTLDRCFHDPSIAAAAERRRILAERLDAEDFPAFARAMARTLAGVIAADRQPLRALAQPALLVWGREDRLIALARSRRILRDVPHARLVVLDRCGHLPQLERPDVFNETLADFLRVVEAAPRPRPRAA